MSRPPIGPPGNAPIRRPSIAARVAFAPQAPWTDPPGCRGRCLWAPWCGPCRAVAPAVEAAAREFAGKLKVVKVDVDQAPGISARFRVQGIPALLLLRDGQPIARQVGAVPVNRLLDWVQEHL